ncbi:glycine cleavage system regulatory protein [Humibacter soli]
MLTVVGDDRAGLVQSVADVVSEHGGNWETSELAELAGAFAGIVLVSVPDLRLDELTRALENLDGLLRITVHGGGAVVDARPGTRFTFSVLGNDRPGIVRDVTGILTRHGITIDLFSSQTREAPMAGGTLFEATVTARIPDDTDVSQAIADLELLAGEIQVDLSVAE